MVVNNDHDHDETGSNNEDDFDNDHDHPTDSDSNSDEQEDQHLLVQLEEPFQPLRRSNRQSVQPGYLDDYVLQAEVECERLQLSIENEPRNFKEAKYLKEWRDMLHLCVLNL